MGIPTMVVTREGFTGLVVTSFKGMGFPAEAPTIHEFPLDMFLPGADLTPLREGIEHVVYALTKWEPTAKEKGTFVPPMITVQGKDYQEALTNMNDLFVKNMWSDGLPLLPATEERVNWILTGTDLPDDERVGLGQILPGGGICTVRQLAVLLAMAGGRPEYMPVLIAAVEALTVPEGLHSDWSATTASTFPAVVVNGPIGRQLRINSGYGLMGADPQHPADGPIGRALRLMFIDLGGARPGIGTMALFGAGWDTNIVIAEDEEGLPEGWNSLSVDRGFAKGSNVVTVLPVNGAINIQLTTSVSKTPEGAVQEGLWRIVSLVGNVAANNATYDSDPSHTSGFLLVPRGRAAELVKVGWPKGELVDFLWENTKTPWDFMLKAGRISVTKNSGTAEGEAIPKARVTLVVAGGEQGGHAYWLQAGKKSYMSSVEVKLPANWDELLAQAEADLGPLPER